MRANDALTDLNEFYRRMTPAYWDSLRRTAEAIEDAGLAIAAANPVWQQSEKYFNPELMERLARMDRLAARVSQALTPALLEYSRVSDQLSRCFLSAAGDATSAGEMYASAFRPVFDAISRGDPLEGRIMGLSHVLQDQLADSGDDASDPPLAPDDGDREAAVEAVSEILSDRNWEQALMAKLTAIREKHPVQARLILLLLTLLFEILSNYLGNLLWETKKPAALREAPTPAASVVFNIDASRPITIVNQVRYYYQVEYTDPETGKKHTGWITKRSTQPIQLFEEGD